MPHLLCQMVGEEMPSTWRLTTKTGILKSMNVASQWTGKAECSEKSLRRRARVLLLPEKFIRVFRMSKLDMTHSWEGGQGCLYPNLLCQQEVNYLFLRFSSFHSNCPLGLWWLSSCQHIPECMFMYWKEIQKLLKSLYFPPPFKCEDVLHISYISKVQILWNTVIYPKWKFLKR